LQNRLGEGSVEQNIFNFLDTHLVSGFGIHSTGKITVSTITNPALNWNIVDQLRNYDLQLDDFENLQLLSSLHSFSLKKLFNFQLFHLSRGVLNFFFHGVTANSVLNSLSTKQTNRLLNHLTNKIDRRIMKSAAQNLTASAETTNPFPHKEYDITNICGQIFVFWRSLQKHFKLGTRVCRDRRDNHLRSQSSSCSLW
jgi:hypothetical protein